MNQIILQAYFPTDIESCPKDEAPLLLVFMDMTANIPCHSEYKCNSKMTKQTHLVYVSRLTSLRDNTYKKPHVVLCFLYF